MTGSQKELQLKSQILPRDKAGEPGEDPSNQSLIQYKSEAGFLLLQNQMGHPTSFSNM